MEVKIGKMVDFSRELTVVNDTTVVYGRVRANDDVMSSIDNGIIKDDSENQIASFSYYGNLSVNFNVSDSENMMKALTAANAYIAYATGHIDKLKEGINDTTDESSASR